MQKVILFHGMHGTPDNFWFPWLSTQLQGQGMTVSALQMPQPDKPDLSVWTPYAMENLTFDDETILIGHSAGCPLILSILSQLQRPIKRAILVAGFVRLKEMTDDNPMLIPDAAWDKIRTNCSDFFFINSDDDPWGCDHTQGEDLRRRLGGTAVTMTGAKHFGSKVFDQRYDTFPLLKDICLLA